MPLWTPRSSKFIRPPQDLQCGYIGNSGFSYKSGSSHTFSGQSLGSAAPAGFDKYIVAGLAHIEGSSSSSWGVNTMTVDGESGEVAAAIISVGSGVRVGTWLFIAGPITATSGNVVWNLDSSRSGDWINSCWYIYADSNYTFDKTKSDQGSDFEPDPSTSLTQTAGGAMVGIGMSVNGGPTITTTNIDNTDWQIDANTDDDGVGAHEETDTAETVTVRFNMSEFISCASFAQWDKPT